MSTYVSLYDAAKRSQNTLFQGMALSVVTTNEVAARIPFRLFEGLALSYRREGSPPSTSWIPDAGTMPAPSSGTDDLVTVPIRQLGGDFDVIGLADDLSGGADTAAQLPRKCKAAFDSVLQSMMTGGNTTSHTLGSSADPFAAIDSISYGPWLDSDRFGPGSLKYTHAGQGWQFRAPGDRDYGPVVPATTSGTSYTLYSDNASRYITLTLDVSDATGNGETHIRFASSTNEFDGMNRLCSADMVIPSSRPDGDEFSFATLDALMSLEKIRTNRAFFMHSKLVRQFLAMNRSLGGTTPEHMSVPGFSGPTISYRGVPILEADHIATTEAKGASSTLSSIYLASLDATDGLFLGVPNRGQQFDVQADPRSIPVLGWRVESLGALEGSNRRRTRVTWAGALGLGSSKGLARASEIQTV